MSFHAQLLRDLEQGNDVDYNYYSAASSRSPSHYRTEPTSSWKAALHFSAPVLLVLAGIVYTLLHAYDLTWLSLTDALWNYIVHFTPYKLIVIFDKEAQAASLGGSKFSTSVSHAEKSAMMRRLIGLDQSGGIINSVASAGRRRLSLVPGLSSLNLRGGGGLDDTRPAGLGNWDNSCYQNSVLQGLASLKGFDEYLEGPYADDDSVDSQKTLSDEAPGAELQMANSLRNLIHKLNDPSNNGTRLWTPAALKNMSSWQQQDAQEYFSKVLDEIDKEIERAALKKSNPPAPGLAGFSSLSSAPHYNVNRHFKGHVPQLRNPLEGLLAQRVACTICRYTEGLSLIPFTTLTLSLPQTSRPSWQTSFSLPELLDAYTKLEFIDEVVCTSCTLYGWRDEISSLLRHKRVKTAAVQGARNHLKRIIKALEDGDFDENFVRDKVRVRPEHFDLSTKSKQVVVARPPKSLVVHVNRSMFNERTGELSKNSSPVNFGHRFDLGPWCLGSASRPGAKVNGIKGPDEEDWTTNPSRSMISRSTPDTSPEKYVQNGLASQGMPGYEYAFHPEKKSMVEGPVYGLRAVIVHQGHHENGHYITYRKYAVPVKKEEDEMNVDEDDDDGAVELDSLYPLNESSAIDAALSPDLSPPFAPRPKVASLATLLPDRNSTPSTSFPRSSPLSSDLADEIETRDDWFRISDDDVCPVTQSEVLARSQGVFMLFYDQISPARRVDAVANPPDPMPDTNISTPQLMKELQSEGLKVAAWSDTDPSKSEEEEDIYVDDDGEECDENMQRWLTELDILSADGTFDRNIHHDFSSPDTAIYNPVNGTDEEGGGGVSSPHTAIYDPVRGREGVHSPQAPYPEIPPSSHLESVVEEPELEHVKSITPTLPSRIQEVKPEDLLSSPSVLSPSETPGSEHVEFTSPFDSELTSRASTIEPSESDITSTTTATSTAPSSPLLPASSPQTTPEKEVVSIAKTDVPASPAPANRRERKRGKKNKKGKDGKRKSGEEGKMTERGGGMEEPPSGGGSVESGRLLMV